MMDAVAKPDSRRKLLLLLCLLGIASFVFSVLCDPSRAYANVLLATMYFLGITLCGAFFLALQYLTKGAWAVAIRRIPEAVTSFLPFAAVIMFIVWLGQPYLYEWIKPHGDALLLTKIAYLNRPFFTIRLIIYFALWFFLVPKLVKVSLNQDKDRDLVHTFAGMRWSAAYMIAFALTICFVAFDVIMSLEPHWYSTVFGIYYFAGSMLSCMAVLSLLVIILRCQPDLKKVVSDTHVTLLAKLMLTFCIFWAYIWFAQFMLIWYTNMPEETAYFLRRFHHGWKPLFFANLFLNWVVPFLGLLGYRAKRNTKIVFTIAVVVLLGHWLDLYLMVMPSQMKNGPVFGFTELGIFAGVAALFTMVVLATFFSRPVYPKNDPLLEESIHVHE